MQMTVWAANLTELTIWSFHQSPFFVFFFGNGNCVSRLLLKYWDWGIQFKSSLGVSWMHFHSTSQRSVGDPISSRRVKCLGVNGLKVPASWKNQQRWRIWTWPELWFHNNSLFFFSARVQVCYISLYSDIKLFPASAHMKLEWFFFLHNLYLTGLVSRRSRIHILSGGNLSKKAAAHLLQTEQAINRFHNEKKKKKTGFQQSKRRKREREEKLEQDNMQLNYSSISTRRYRTNAQRRAACQAQVRLGVGRARIL